MTSLVFLFLFRDLPSMVGIMTLSSSTNLIVWDPSFTLSPGTFPHRFVWLIVTTTAVIHWSFFLQGKRQEDWKPEEDHRKTPFGILSPSTVTPYIKRLGVWVVVSHLMSSCLNLDSVIPNYLLCGTLLDFSRPSPLLVMFPESSFYESYKSLVFPSVTLFLYRSLVQVLFSNLSIRLGCSIPWNTWHHSINLKENLSKFTRKKGEWVIEDK